jgi:hypothetical protein
MTSFTDVRAAETLGSDNLVLQSSFSQVTVIIQDSHTWMVMLGVPDQ